MLKRTRELQRQTAKVVSAAQATGVQFIMQEIALGRTFIQLATDSRTFDRQDDSKRQQAAAEEALATALRFFSRANLNREQERRITTDLTELAARLKDLES